MIFEVEEYDETQEFDNQTPGDEKRIRELLDKSRGGRNSFWLRIRGMEFPNMNVCLIDGLATANYFEDRAKYPCDWVSKSNVPDLVPGGETAFYYNSEAERQDMDNAVVIFKQSAVEVAMEFFQNPLQRPTSIEWYEL